MACKRGNPVPSAQNAAGVHHWTCHVAKVENAVRCRRNRWGSWGAGGREGKRAWEGVVGEI